MSSRDIVVIGASAGGVEALTRVVNDLPLDLPASVFVVLHLSPSTPIVLPGLLGRRTGLSVVHPSDGETFRKGRIYVAPPDHHLRIKKRTVHLDRGPKEKNARPAIDTLFRSAARAGGRRVVGVVLSGTLEDGTAGLLAVKEAGGVAVVQDPREALHAGMPESAIAGVNVDHVIAISGMAGLLKRLVEEPLD